MNDRTPEHDLLDLTCFSNLPREHCSYACKGEKSKCAAAYSALHAHTSSPFRVKTTHLPSLTHSAPGKTSSWPLGLSSGNGAWGIAQYRPAGNASI